MKLTINLTPEELKSLDRLVWQEERRLEMRMGGYGLDEVAKQRLWPVRAKVVKRLQDAITYASTDREAN